MVRTVALGAVVTVTVALAMAATASAQTAALEIPRLASPPTLETFLSAPESPLAVVSAFTQRQPGDGEPASQRTTAYAGFDDDHFYVVFVCRDDDPSQIRARLTRREGMLSDDRVSVAIDTFGDHQRAYLFIVNPLGIQADGIIAEGRGEDFSFDTLWRSEGRLTPDGYVVLLAIPFKSLRFPRGDAQSWGVAFGRHIPRNNEESWWPQITTRIEGVTQQFARAQGIRGVSPGRNAQLIPYGAFAGARFFDGDRAAYGDRRELRAGLDAKLVVRDAVTIDAALNPDFSQVESDSPQVTVNQRFEVFFPEKRPFFIENAELFQTPGEQLFFSRRVADPQLGTRVTGKLGAWAFGALAIDDRAAGRRLPAGHPARDDRAWVAVGRAQRDLGNQSNVAFMVTSRDFASSVNRTAAVDARVKLTDNWVVTGQAVASETQTLNGARLSGPAFNASLTRASRGLFYNLFYSDRSPEYRADLGFVPRTDVRELTNFLTYRWRPRRGPVVAFGPNSFAYVNWDHSGVLQDWIVRMPFQFELKGETSVFVRRVESYQRFGGIGFREHENLINGGTAYWKWLSIYGSILTAKRPNFFPAEGLAPFQGDALDASLNVVVRPQPALRLEGLYIYSRLTTAAGARIFDNHIVRARVDHQLTREWSIRGIVDYNAVLANPALIALQRDKRLSADVLATYLVNPGTAIYLGYSDGYENLAFQPDDPASVRRFGAPVQSTGRQFFVKTSYLWRF
jgi:hypothetical protein